MRKSKIKLIDKIHTNVVIYIYDDVIQFNLGSRFVAISNTYPTYGLMPLEFVVDNYKFPKDGDRLPMLVRYIRGLDDELYNKIEFYDDDVKSTVTN